MNSSLKKKFHLIGGTLGLAGVIFIVIRFYQYAGQLDFDSFGTTSWLLLIALAIICTFANFLLAIAWWYILGFLEVKVTKSWAMRTYGISQVAKYVPGNIFQFAGRQALGLAANLPGWALAKSVFWELFLISFTGATFFCLAAPSLLLGVSINFGIISFLLTIFIVYLCLRQYLTSFTANAFLIYIVFLSISGLIFVGTLLLVIDIQSTNYKLIIICGSSYILAWLAGLVTPGAPAGVGVREIAILFLLGPELAKPDLLLSLLLNRMITVAGDTCFFSYFYVTRHLIDI